MNFVARTAVFVHRQLHNPARIFAFSASFVGISLAANGSLFNLYALNREQKTLGQQIEQIRKQNLKLDLDLKQANDPSFIERQAVDRYDLAEQNDLVFVFAD